MLMPSALSCDSSHPPLTRLQSALFATPPASPPALSTQTAIGNIFTSCRSLQSLLASSTPAAAQFATTQQLPTPPLAHAPPPLKLRLRSRAKVEGDKDHLTPRKKIAKRAPAVQPRGVNKRRRGVDDDMGRDDVGGEDNADVESDLEISEAAPKEAMAQAPHTPKRARISPEHLPLGLERSDFHSLHLQEAGDSNHPMNGGVPGTDVLVEADGEAWSTEDDRILVELVLDKLKLSKTDWQDCARSLGKDRGSVGRRWKSLMIGGEVGLKRSSRRSKIHGTWR